MIKKSTASTATTSSASIVRYFKTADAAKLASKRGISNADMCKAIRQLIAGGPTKLPGGVYKKRINNNLDRAIVLCRDGSNNWFFVGLFQKSDIANITNGELENYQKLAQHLAAITDDQLSALLKAQKLLEIFE